LAEIASDHPIGTTLAYIDGPDRYHSAYSFVFLRRSFSAGFNSHIRVSAAGRLGDGMALLGLQQPRCATRCLPLERRRRCPRLRKGPDGAPIVLRK
jgi:hypothetical protein